MKVVYLIFVFLFCILTVQSQFRMIEGDIAHASEGYIYLAAYHGDNFRLIDSIESAQGHFAFILPPGTEAGVFRLIYDEVYEGVLTTDQFVELIYNEEELKVYVDRDERGPLPQFGNSMENQVYLDFVEYQLAFEYRLSECYSRLFPALAGDRAYEEAVIAYENLQLARLHYIDSVMLNYPELYASRIMRAFRMPVIPGTMPHEKRMDTLKLLFFEDAPIDDPLLLNAPVYSFRIIDYLSIYQDPYLDSEQQQETFKEAVDQIMVNVSHEEELRSFVAEFLLEGFELLGMEEVQVYLADFYLDENCDSDIVQLVESRREGYETIKTGSPVPDFVIRDMQGRNHRLSALPGEYVLLIFWASTCVHCQHMLPEFRDWYLENEDLGLEIVTISLDSSAMNFEAFMEEHPMPWISSHDPLGWNGKIAADYYIYATPSMFLLDRERRIIARPVNFRQFTRSLRTID